MAVKRCIYRENMHRLIKSRGAGVSDYEEEYKKHFYSLDTFCWVYIVWLQYTGGAK